MINLNSDLGEGAGSDEAILAVIDSANLACGVHAGSPMESIRVAGLCRERGVEVGAHPGYDDRARFGREETGQSVAAIEALIRFQVGALAAVVPIAYIKAHGALYHRCQVDPEAAAALARCAKDFGVGVMGQPGFEIIAAAKTAGIPAYREGFADRAYLPDGRLAPRSQPGAVLDSDAAAAQALRLAREGGVDSLCIHGDSPGAAAVARSVQEALSRSGIETGPLRR